MADWMAAVSSVVPSPFAPKSFTLAQPAGAVAAAARVRVVFAFAIEGLLSQVRAALLCGPVDPSWARGPGGSSAARSPPPDGFTGARAATIVGSAPTGRPD